MIKIPGNLFKNIKYSIIQENAITFKHSVILASSLDDLINAIVEADNRGVTLAPMAERSGGSNTSVPSWSFGQSFFFASTVVTTIGNSHLSNRNFKIVEKM